jgi:phytoene desaturase
MARNGWEVTVLEKHATPGGRARQLKEQGFTFDMGPSWYWMPEVFERYFAQFGKKVSDYYSLQRLDPSYKVYTPHFSANIPAGLDALKQFFDMFEPGSGAQLEKFLAEAAYKYKTGVGKLVFKPGRSVSEFLDWDVIKGVSRLDIFKSMRQHVRRYFNHPFLQQLLEFPVLFLGALPQDTPALYSLMNYADMIGGTWYPRGGMYSIVQGMYDLALELGVQFYFEEDVQRIHLQNNNAKRVITQHKEWEADVVIGSADYHFIETQLLPPEARSYTDSYWDKRVMAPSCLLYYVGLNRKLNNVAHHSLFFDAPFEPHAASIYTDKRWPTNPMFYTGITSVTDDTVAPPGGENLFLLIPVAAGLTGDTESLRDAYFDNIIRRMEESTMNTIRDSIVYKKSFGPADFTGEYNSFRGNAYGLANTLRQTAILKPACRSKKIKNLFYTGQLTVPGPGVPPSLISGEVVAGEVIKHFGR